MAAIQPFVVRPRNFLTCGRTSFFDDGFSGRGTATPNNLFERRPGTGVGNGVYHGTGESIPQRLLCGYPRIFVFVNHPGARDKTSPAARFGERARVPRDYRYGICW